MKNNNNREQKAKNKKWHISETAMALFKERGYDKVKVKEICKAANISLGTFYHYFSSKDSIVDEIYEIIDARVFECIEEVEFDSPLNKIIGILEQSACIMEEELGFLLISDSYYQIISSKPDYSYSHERKLYITLVETIEEGKELGAFKDDTNSKEIAEACLRMGRGNIIDWCLNGGTYKLCELIVKDLQRLLYSIDINN
ncbi:MAG: TetR/AcrR family transcriptional regulator [Pleomorphochaeta sp.]